MSLWTTIKGVAQKAIKGSDILRGITSGQSGPAPRNTQAFLEAFNTMPWVNADIGKIAYTAGSVQWVLKAPKLASGPIGKSAGGKRNRYVELKKLKTASKIERRKAMARFEENEQVDTIEEHPALDLLNDPLAEVFGGNDEKSLVYAYKLLVGESFELIDRSTDPLRKSAVTGQSLPVRLWPVPPTWVQSIPTPETPYFRISRNQLQLDVPYTEMLWDKTLNPVNPYLRGMGKLQSLADELDADEQAAKLVSYSFYNKNRPDLLVTVPGMKEAELKAFIEDWKSSLQGAKNAGKTHFTNIKDAKVEDFGEDFRSMQVKEMRIIGRDFIRQVLGIPPEIIGITETSNRSTIDAASYIFNTQVIEPFLETRRAFLQKQVIDEFDPRLVLDYVSLLDEDKEFALKVAQMQPHVLRVNEFRSMIGQDKLSEAEGGELFIIADQNHKAVMSLMELVAAAPGLPGAAPGVGVGADGNPMPNISGVPMIPGLPAGNVPGLHTAEDAKLSAQTPHQLPPGSVLAKPGVPNQGTNVPNTGTPAPPLANTAPPEKPRPPFKSEAAEIIKALIPLLKEFREEDHPRDDRGRFDDGGGGGSEGDRGKAAIREAVGSNLAGIGNDPKTETEKSYKPDVEKDGDGDGVTDAARVGVPGDSVPPPPTIPRLPNLSPDERAVESGFADRFEADPEGMARQYMVLAEGAGNTFETDAAKMLDPNWNPSKEAGRSDEQVKDARAMYNTALHQTANAIAKKAFLMKLDTLKPGDEVLITSGGVAAGKGYALKTAVPELKDSVKAVWDAAGDQNATENPWIMKELQSRALKGTFVYVNSDPEIAFPRALTRAQETGRIVDAAVFADSYTLGAWNFQAFMEKNRMKADFVILDNRTKPAKLDSIPKESLSLGRRKVFDGLTREIKSREGSLRPSLKRGALGAIRYWPELFGQGKRSHASKSLSRSGARGRLDANRGCTWAVSDPVARTRGQRCIEGDAIGVSIHKNAPLIVAELLRRAK